MSYSASAEATAMLHALASLQDHELDLGLVMLWLSKIEYPEADLESYFEQLDCLADELNDRIAPTDNPRIRALKLVDFLADDCDFRGNSEEFYDPRNSYLTCVLDRHMGIPISLSGLYIEVGKRVGVELEGIGFPYHFLLGVRDVDDLFIDPFHGGKILNQAGCQELLVHITDGRMPFSPNFLYPIGARQMLVRVFRNLKNIYVRQFDLVPAIRMANLILTWAPDEWSEYRDRGLMYLERNQTLKGIADLEEYIARVPKAPDQAKVLEHLRRAHRDRRDIN